MVFVNEKIGQEYQTIDRELNIKLKYLGLGGPESPHNFQISLNEQLINFQAWRKEINKPNKHYDVIWDVVKLYISDFPPKKKIEIIEAIKGALNEFGAFSTRENVDNVQVNFKTPEMN